MATRRQREQEGFEISIKGGVATARHYDTKAMFTIWYPVPLPGDPCNGVRFVMTEGQLARIKQRGPLSQANTFDFWITPNNWVRYWYGVFIEKVVESGELFRMDDSLFKHGFIQARAWRPTNDEEIKTEPLRLEASKAAPPPVRQGVGSPVISKLGGLFKKK